MLREQLDSLQRKWNHDSVEKVLLLANETEQAWPTEAHERAKARLKERQEALHAAGLDPKLAKKRQAKLQEQHFDDCGSDFGPLERDVGKEEVACVVSSSPEWLEFVLWGDYAGPKPDDNEVHYWHSSGLFDSSW